MTPRHRMTVTTHKPRMASSLAALAALLGSTHLLTTARCVSKRSQNLNDPDVGGDTIGNNNSVSNTNTGSINTRFLATVSSSITSKMRKKMQADALALRRKLEAECQDGLEWALAKRALRKRDPMRVRVMAKTSILYSSDTSDTMITISISLRL